MVIRFCPKCGNQNFEDVREGKLPGMSLHHAYKNPLRCKNCGFTSVTFPEAKNQKEVNKIRKGLGKYRDFKN